jgi:hypothetical protein
MPIYQATCATCGAYHEYIRPVSQCLDAPDCCGTRTVKQIFSPPMGIVDIPAYESPATGKWITSRSERREDFKRSGCREWEGAESERKEASKVKAADEAKQDAAIEHTVRTAWAALPPSKKAEALAVT